MSSPRQRPLHDSVPAPADGALLARVAQGEVSALSGLYDSYAGMLLRFARRLGAGDEAEDVVQTVFLRVVRLAFSFDPSATSARSWLFAITVRVVQERRRALCRLGRALSALAQQKSPAVTVAGPQAADLHACLQQLSHAKRTVVLLVEVEGFSCLEVAQMLDIPVGTVWTRLHHARNELRASWGDPS